MSDLSIIPECYVDTNLIETLVPPQTGYNHQKGCGTVSNRMKGKLADAFAVGIIDKDKKDLDYLSEFHEVTHSGNLYLFKHQTRHHYLIQISPAVEQFILNNAAKVGISLTDPDYNLFNSLQELRNVSKTLTSKNDHRFKRLFRDIRNKRCAEFILLAAWISYLKANTYQADLEELKNL